MQLVSNYKYFSKLLGICVLLFVFSGQVMAEGKTLAEFKPVLTEPFKVLLREATPDEGEIVYMRKCSSCHDHKKSGGHGKGAHLWNILNRKAGAAKGFDYSEAMKKSGHSWDLASLNYYLTNTKQAVPGRTMEFRGIRRDKVRARLLVFLNTLNDSQQPLP